MRLQTAVFLLEFKPIFQLVIENTENNMVSKFDKRPAQNS